MTVLAAIVLAVLFDLAYANSVVENDGVSVVYHTTCLAVLAYLIHGAL